MYLPFFGTGECQTQFRIEPSLKVARFIRGHTPDQEAKSRNFTEIPQMIRSFGYFNWKMLFNHSPKDIQRFRNIVKLGLRLPLEGIC